MPPQFVNLPQGTLDLLILCTLALQPIHEWAVSERIHQISRDVLRVQQGSLYPALHRLERRGWIKARWGTSENNRKAKFYELTKAGRRHWKLSIALGKAISGRPPDLGNGVGGHGRAARRIVSTADPLSTELGRERTR